MAAVRQARALNDLPKRLLLALNDQSQRHPGLGHRDHPGSGLRLTHACLPGRLRQADRAGTGQLDQQSQVSGVGKRTPGRKTRHLIEPT